MLHNQRRKSKGENFFILLFLLQEMMQAKDRIDSLNKMSCQSCNPVFS